MGPQRMYPLHPYREGVEKAVAAENLQEVASRTSDAEILLGFAFLAQAGNPVRKELASLALKANPEYARVAAVLPLMLDGVDEDAVQELIDRDFDNALGHYFR